MAFKDFFKDKASNENQKPKILIAFQGGGSHGAFEAGVYRALVEAGIEAEGFIGTSAGANNAACAGYAANKGDYLLGARLMAQLWVGIGREGDKISHLKSFARATSFTRYPNLPESFVKQMELVSQTGSLLGAKSQAGHVRDHIDNVIPDWSVIRNGHIPVVIGATLRSGGMLHEHNFTNPDIDADAIGASSCISGVHIKNGQAFIDGGHMKNPPLHGAFDENDYTDVIAIMLNPVPDAVEPKLQRDVTHIRHDFIGPEVYQELAYLKENSDLNMHAIGMDHEPHWNQTSKMNFVSSWIGELYDRGYQAGLEWVKAHRHDLGIRSSFNPVILEYPALQAEPQVA